MVNEPEKWQIWTWWFAGCMYILEKNSWTKDRGNLDPPSILVISPSKPWNFLGDGSIYERHAWRHKENILNFFVTAWFLALSFSFVFLRFLLEFPFSVAMWCGNWRRCPLLCFQSGLPFPNFFPRPCHFHPSPNPNILFIGNIPFLLKE